MEKIMIKAYIPLDLYNEMIAEKGDDSISSFVREDLKSHIAAKKSNHAITSATFSNFVSTPSSAISPKE